MKILKHIFRYVEEFSHRKRRNTGIAVDKLYGNRSNYMIIDDLKKIIKNTNSVLLLEDGEPSFIVLEYGAYMELVSKMPEEKKVEVKFVKEDNIRDVPRRDNEREILDRLNKDILALKDQIEAEEKAVSPIT